MNKHFRISILDSDCRIKDEFEIRIHVPILQWMIDYMKDHQLGDFFTVAIEPLDPFAGFDLANYHLDLATQKFGQYIPLGSCPLDEKELELDLEPAWSAFDISNN